VGERKGGRGGEGESESARAYRANTNTSSHLCTRACDRVSACASTRACVRKCVLTSRDRHGLYLHDFLQRPRFKRLLSAR